ncbi:GNAT family N-acetyltransferase [Arthrobacter monumenti]
MPQTDNFSPLRAMTAADVPGVVDIQELGAIRVLSDVFPQDLYPFPRDDVAHDWQREISTPGIDCSVVLLGEAVVGFAATRGEEFLHFGIAIEHWGTGIARRAHDAVLGRMRSRGIRHARLVVFTGNRRGRRFYEKLGWLPTGERTHSSFPPWPELLRYERSVERDHGTH